MEEEIQEGDILLHERFGFHLFIEKLEYRNVYIDVTDYDTDEEKQELIEKLYISFINLESGKRSCWSESGFYSKKWLKKVA